MGVSGKLQAFFRKVLAWGFVELYTVSSRMVGMA